MKIQISVTYLQDIIWILTDFSKTKDWVGLVDIVLRGEAALLENRKSGEEEEQEEE